MSRILVPPTFSTNHPDASDPSPPAKKSGASQEPLWRRAQRRALGYLEVMGAPTLEGHELVMEALKRAQQTIRIAGRGDPAKETVRILRRLLNDRGLFSNMGPQYGRWFKYGSLRHRSFRTEGDLSGGITSMPPINRGVMSTD
jgi:hypothetical protein